MPPEKSTFAYPNKFARIYLESLEEVIGRNGLNAVLNLADLEVFIRFQPPDNMEKGFDFSYMTALQRGLREMAGVKMGHGMASKAGQVAFKHAYREFGGQLELDELQALALPIEDKLDVTLPMMAEFFTRFSDQVSNAYCYDDERYVYTLERCPMCWGQKSTHPLCHAGKGLIEAALHWLSGGQNFRVDIQQCIAKGDDMGKFVIYKTPV